MTSVPPVPAIHTLLVTDRSAPVPEIEGAFDALAGVVLAQAGNQ